MFVFVLLFPITVFSNQNLPTTIGNEDAGIKFLSDEQKPARRFTVLFTGDAHSHLEQTQRIAHSILMEKQNPDNGDVVVADVGDMLTGTEYFEVSKGALEIEMMNLAGYNISTIGNHEWTSLCLPFIERRSRRWFLPKS